MSYYISHYIIILIEGLQIKSKLCLSIKIILHVLRLSFINIIIYYKSKNIGRYQVGFLP